MAIVNGSNQYNEDFVKVRLSIQVSNKPAVMTHVKHMSRLIFSSLKRCFPRNNLMAFVFYAFLSEACP
jgi:excinuclease UvrABC helicase subunit UvrB